MVDGLLSLRWNNHRSTFCHIISTLKQKESYSDATLACDGTFYPVHKLVLSVCSEYFENMLEKTPCKHPVIVLRDVQPNDLEALLSYMYDGSVSVAQDDLARFIKTAEMLRIKGLAVPDDPPPTDKGTKRPASPSHSRPSRDGRSPASRRKRRKEREEYDKSKSFESNDDRGGDNEIEEVLMPIKQEIQEIEHNEEVFGSVSGINPSEDSTSDYNVDNKDNIDLSLGQNLLSMSQDVSNLLPEGSDSQNPSDTGDGGGTSNLEPWLGDDLDDLDYGEGDYPSESGESFQDSQGVQHQSEASSTVDLSRYLVEPLLGNIASGCLSAEVLEFSPKKKRGGLCKNMGPVLGKKTRPGLGNALLDHNLKYCSYCDYKSAILPNYKRHLLAHVEEEKTFSCAVCPFKCDDKTKLKRHELALHAEKKRYQCSRCTYHSNSMATMRKHMTRKHKVKNPKISLF